MEKILRKIFEKNKLNKNEMIYLLNNLTPYWQEKLFNYARQTLLKTYGKRVYLRGLLEYSNFCQNNCKYCGLRKANNQVTRYRLTSEEIIKSLKKADKLGYKTFVLQSGEDNYYTDEILCDLIKKIKKFSPDNAVTLSIGERSYKSYQKLFEAGADRYLLRHETVSNNIYRKLHPSQKLKNRKKCLTNLAEIGYQTGAGFIIGLPEQNNKTIAENLLYLKKIEPDMVGIGPLIPHPDTPLSDCKTGSVKLTLVCYALTRLLLPETLIPATTALNTVDEKGWEKGLKAGANVIMPNLSPSFIREKYEIYKGKGNTDVSKLNKIKKRIEQTGFKVDMGRGDSLNWLRKKGKLSLKLF
ncbi:MAG: [FeFe] hydrogenase H-cluster radical SAM maturase HydE [Candidatus Muiribacteriota bacterium]